MWAARVLISSPSSSIVTNLCSHEARTEKSALAEPHGDRARCEGERAAVRERDSDRAPAGADYESEPPAVDLSAPADRLAARRSNPDRERAGRGSGGSTCERQIT